MMRENDPIPPYEWPGVASFCEQVLLRGVWKHSWREESRVKKSFYFSLIQRFSCWDVAGWKVEAQTGLCSACCEAFGC